MYRIAICEDEPLMLEQIRGMVEEILAEADIPFHIDVAHNGDALLSLLRQPDYQCHLILLDIMMGETNGMDTARRLRELGHPASIIFVTISEGYAIQGYDVRAVNYLLKPVDREQLRRNLLYDYNTNHLEHFLVLPQRTESHSIPIRDITYLEIVHRRLAVHVGDRVILHTAKLDDIQAQLPAHLFARCHKSYLANLLNAKAIRRYRLTMANGDEVPISKAYYDELKHRFLDRFDLEL